MIRRWREKLGKTYDGPVLLEGGGSLNAGLVGTSADVDVIGAAVRGHLALLLGIGRRVVGAKVLNDVVLYKRVLRPAVHSEVL